MNGLNEAIAMLKAIPRGQLEALSDQIGVSTTYIIDVMEEISQILSQTFPID